MKKILTSAVVTFSIISCGTASIGSVPQDESIDIAYGTVSRDNNAMTVDKVNVNQVDEVIYDDIFDFLRGKVPGVEVGYASGVGERPHIQIRGRRSILGNEGEPLFLVDGVEYIQIESIQPEEIHSVQVLKDAAASAYGSRGADGVILITTKVAHEAAERERAQRKAARAERRME